jgi:anti-anti-sigma factor
VTDPSNHPPGLHMAVHTDGDRATISLTGELDRFSGAPLAQLLDTAMDGSAKHLDVQMAQLRFVDVDGVRVLVHAYQLGAGRGVKLTLHDPQPDIVWLLHTTAAAMLLGDSSTPAEAALLPPVHAAPPVTTGETMLKTPSVPPAGTNSERDRSADERDRSADERDRSADERDRSADERERFADEREEQSDDLDRLALERERVVDERQQRASEHQRWEDIREDVADARERDLERREHRG